MFLFHLTRRKINFSPQWNYLVHSTVALSGLYFLLNIIFLIKKKGKTKQTFLGYTK